MTVKQFRKWLARRNETETLESIALDFGAHLASVSNWIRGKRDPSRMVLKLAEKLRGK